MALFAVVPMELRAVKKIRSILINHEAVELYSKDDDDEKRDLMKNYTFASYEGTESELSELIFKRIKPPTVDYIVFNMSFDSIAGYAPSRLIQWMKIHAR